MGRKIRIKAYENFPEQVMTDDEFLNLQKQDPSNSHMFMDQSGNPVGKDQVIQQFMQDHPGMIEYADVPILKTNTPPMVGSSARGPGYMQPMLMNDKPETDGSVGGLAKNLLYGTIDTINPYNIAAAVWNLNQTRKNGVGFGDVASAAAKDYQDFYGSGHFLENAYQHPERPMMDAATILSLGGSGAEMANLPRVASAARVAAEVADPLTAAGRVTKLAANQTIGRTQLPEYFYKKWLTDLGTGKTFAGRQAEAAATDRLANAGVRQYGITPNKKGIAKSTGVISSIDTARENAVGAGGNLPLSRPFEDIVIPPVTKDLPQMGKASGSSAKKSIDTATSTAQETVKGAKVYRDKDGNIVGASPYLFRSSDQNRPIITTPEGEFYPRSVNRSEALDIIKTDNKQLADYYDKLGKGQPTNISDTEAQTISKMNKALREDLDSIIGDIPIDIPGRQGKEKTMKFKELGKEEGNVLELRDKIVEYLQRNKNLNRGNFSTTAQWKNAVTRALSTKGMQAKLGVWLAGSNPTTRTVRRVGSVAGHAIQETEGAVNANPPLIQKESVDTSRSIPSGTRQRLTEPDLNWYK